MIIRSAVLEGTVAESDRAQFDEHMQKKVMAGILRYPGIRDLRLRRAAETEAGAPPIYMIFDLYFDSAEAMHAALASPIRQEVRATITEAMSAFKGRVYHLILDEIPQVM
jgi:uncharacterized protein (TIGR02118 family)